MAHRRTPRDSAGTARKTISGCARDSAQNSLRNSAQMALETTRGSARNCAKMALNTTSEMAPKPTSRRRPNRPRISGAPSATAHHARSAMAHSAQSATAHDKRSAMAHDGMHRYSEAWCYEYVRISKQRLRAATHETTAIDAKPRSGSTPSYQLVYQSGPF